MSYGWNVKYEEGPMTVTLELRSNELGEDEKKLMSSFHKAVKILNKAYFEKGQEEFQCDACMNPNVICGEHADVGSELEEAYGCCGKCSGGHSTHAGDACEHE